MPHHNSNRSSSQAGKRYPFILLILSATLIMSGCQTTARKWGSGATIAPGWQRIKQAAVNAAKDPITWTHAAAAVVVYASGKDEEWEEKMQDDKPLFGGDAAKKTDEYRDALNIGRIGIALLTPSGDDASEWLWNKTKGLAVEAAAMSLTTNVTGVLKNTVRRKEPDFDEDDDNNYEAFTSAHATEPFASAALIRRDLNYIDMPRWGKNTINIAAYTLAAGSALGRIEMGIHHPSDQLAGAAIGNFLALFVHDAFLGEESPVTVSFRTTGDEISGMLHIGF